MGSLCVGATIGRPRTGNARPYTQNKVMCFSMPSPLGRVAERSEAGRGDLFRHGLRRATFPRGEGLFPIPSGIGFKVLLQEKQTDCDVVFSVVCHGVPSVADFLLV